MVIIKFSDANVFSLFVFVFHFCFCYYIHLFLLIAFTCYLFCACIWKYFLYNLPVTFSKRPPTANARLRHQKKRATTQHKQTYKQEYFINSPKKSRSEQENVAQNRRLLQRIGQVKGGAGAKSLVCGAVLSVRASAIFFNFAYKILMKFVFCC